MSNRIKTFIETIEKLGRGKGIDRAFSDFLDITALSYQMLYEPNKADLDRLKALQDKAGSETIETYDKLLNLLWMEAETQPYSDTIGHIFEQLELMNKKNGQYYTPEPVAALVAQMITNKAEYEAIIERDRYITVLDECAGSGRLMLAKMKTIHDAGIDVAFRVYVTAWELDSRAVNMLYLNFLIHNISGVIYQGNSLSRKPIKVLRSPAHYNYLWKWRFALEKLNAITSN